MALIDLGLLTTQKNAVSVSIEEMDNDSKKVTVSLNALNRCLNLYGTKASDYLNKSKLVQELSGLNESDALLITSADYMSELLNIKYKYDMLINWLNRYRVDINKLVNLSFEFGNLVPHEQTPNKKTLMLNGVMYIDFCIDGLKFTVDTLADIHLGLENGYPVIVDSSFYEGDNKGFDQILDEAIGDQLDIDTIEKDIEELFYQYFKCESVPMWQDKLIGSFVNQDILSRLHQL